MSRRNLRPYPGLRAFERAESCIFFGRQQQIDELLTRLKNHKFLAILGTSGSGKSSLMKAGVLAGLEKGYMGEIGSRWSIAEMKPGSSPFANLAESLLKDKLFREAWVQAATGQFLAGSNGEAEKILPTSPTSLTAELRRGVRSLDEILQHSPLAKGTKLLLLVDQFEELFRFRKKEENQATAFVALLLEASRHQDIYVAITMRSDFLGYAAEFQNLPEAINDGLYLTPRLTRNQLYEAICLPAKLFGGAVEDRLANHLLNEAGNNPDQLPLLQHAMMRLWETDEDKILTLEEYQELNGLKGALNEHAEQAWNELDSNAQVIAESLFRALTECHRHGQDTRHPLELKTLLDITETDLPTLMKVIDTFRQGGRNFLMPLPQVPLTLDTMVDISHESLIRQWQRLQDWVEAEAEKVDMYQRLLADAKRRATGQGGELWYSTDLTLALKWESETRPNLAWAEHYGKRENFAQAMQFLLDSKALQQQEDDAKKTQRQQEDIKQETIRKQKEKELRQLRLQLVFSFIGLIITAMLAIWGYGKQQAAQESELNARKAADRAIEAESKAKKEAQNAIEAQKIAQDTLVKLSIAKEASRTELEKSYQTAITAEPKNPAPIIRFADFIIAKYKDDDHAELLYKQAIEIAPSDANTILQLASFMSNRRKNYQEAENLYRKALDVDPKSTSSLLQFADFMADKRKENNEAEKLYQLAIESTPKDASTIIQLANFMADKKTDIERAKKLYQQAFEIDTKNPDTLFKFADFMADKGKDARRADELYRQLIRLYQQTIKTTPTDSRRMLWLADFLAERRKDYKEAERLYQQALATNPRDDSIVLQFANFTADKLEDYPLAEQRYQQAIALNSGNILAKVQFADFLVTKRKDTVRANKLYQDAEGLYARTIAIEPRNAEALSKYALLLSRDARNNAEVEKKYWQAIENDPTNIETLRNFALFMAHQRKNYSKAEILFQQAIDADSQNANILADFAQIKLIQGDSQAGKALINRAFSGKGLNLSIKLKLWFYRLAHLSKTYPEAAQAIIQLLKINNKIRAENWDFSATIAQAKREAHPNILLLEDLALVITHQKEIETLAAYSEGAKAIRFPLKR